MMMVDWTTIIIAILSGSSISGLIATILYRRENKRLKESEAKKAEMGAKESEADALIKYGGAMEKLLENIGKQQQSFENSMRDKDDIIKQQKHLIETYKKDLDEALKKISQFEMIFKQNERKINGLQKTIDAEIGKKKFAENNVCFVEDCELRKPPRNTFNNES